MHLPLKESDAMRVYEAISLMIAFRCADRYDFVT